MIEFELVGFGFRFRFKVIMAQKKFQLSTNFHNNQILLLAEGQNLISHNRSISLTKCLHTPLHDGASP